MAARRLTPWSALKRAHRIARDEGLLTLWFKILGETVYRRVVVITHPVEEPLPDPDPHLPVVVARLDATQADELERFRPETPAREVERRLIDGQACHVARLDGRLVYAAWCATGEVWIECLSRYLDLAPDTVYLYEAFAAPEVRGSNVLGAVSAFRACELKAAGITRQLAVVVPENTRARSAFAKLGYREVGILGFVRLGPWRRDFYRRHPGSDGF